MNENSCGCNDSDEKMSSCGCNEESCSTKTSCCSSTNHGHSCSDPVSTTKYMLEKAFFKALMEVQVEKIKKKIESQWGSTLDKTSDAIVQSMSKQWQADISKAEASKELYQELEKIFSKKSQE